MTGGRTRPDSRLNLRDGGRRDRPQPSPFHGSTCQTITQTASVPAHRSGTGRFSFGNRSCFNRRAGNISAPLMPSKSHVGAPRGAGRSAIPVLRQHRGTVAVGVALRAGSGSKGSEAMRLVFSRIDADCGTRRGSDGRPNGPCKAMCFLIVQHHPRWASACDGSVSTCLPVNPGRLRMPRDLRRRIRCEY